MNEAALARLRGAEWLHRDSTQSLMKALGGGESRTRAVGGIVRDTLLDVPRADSDIDLATELTPDEVSERAAAAGATVHPTGIEHGTLTIRLGPLVAEVTTLREDVKTDGRRAVVRFGQDWARDAGRRDFTLNALYVDMRGQLFDPLGGLDDCLAGRVRFIGDPIQRIEEDRLRVFRFFRFSASHGGERFDPDGIAACRGYAGRLSAVSTERVGGEFRRMLDLPRVALTLSTMAGAGIADFRDEELQLLSAYENVAQRPSLAGRLAILVDRRGADALQAQWRLSKQEVRGASEALAAALLVAEGRYNEAAYRHGPWLEPGVDVAASRLGWGLAESGTLRSRLQSMPVPAFPVDGKDLVAAGIPPGPALGLELRRLEQVWIEQNFGPGREELLAMARVG